MLSPQLGLSQQKNTQGSAKRGNRHQNRKGGLIVGEAWRHLKQSVCAHSSRLTKFRKNTSTTSKVPPSSAWRQPLDVPAECACSETRAARVFRHVRRARARRRCIRSENSMDQRQPVPYASPLPAARSAEAPERNTHGEARKHERRPGAMCETSFSAAVAHRSRVGPNAAAASAHPRTGVSSAPGGQWAAVKRAS
jgi:hypothetical protein